MARKPNANVDRVAPHVRARERQPEDWRAIADRLAGDNVPNLLTAEIVAELLGVKRGKTYDLMRTGNLPAIRIGRTIRIQASDLESWLRRDRAVSLLRDRRLSADRERDE